MDTAREHFSKAEKLLAMTTHGIDNMVESFVNMDRREKRQEEYRAKMLFDMEHQHENNSRSHSPATSRPPSAGHHHVHHSHHPHHPHHPNHHHHHHHHHHSHLKKKKQTKNVLEMLDLIMNQVLDKEKVMHNRVGLILTSRVQKYCPMIKELEYSKKGNVFCCLFLLFVFVVCFCCLLLIVLLTHLYYHI